MGYNTLAPNTILPIEQFRQKNVQLIIQNDIHYDYLIQHFTMQSA